MADDGTPLGDLHSHLVPGVDDGARTLDDALDGIARMVERGYDRIVTTPHFRASLTLDRSRFEARLAEMERAWGPLRRAVERRWPELDFRRGFEVRLDSREADLTDERLRLGGTRFALVEWPRMRVPAHAVDLLSRLCDAGVRPVLAHPERYGGLDPDLRNVAEWREAGAFLQVNNGSLVDRYGARARSVAFRLLRRGWVDYLSSDFHGRAHLSLHARQAEARLAAAGGDEHFSVLAGSNPRRLFDDEEPRPVAPLPAGEQGAFLLEGRT